jgi:glutathione synthase/RimK-type ligase-like ATP-grasp enzyme
LPPEIIAKLHELMTRLGLVYGAIDLRLTPEGRYVFLEINPAGQFLYVEYATGQPIAAALARTLSKDRAAWVR